MKDKFDFWDAIAIWGIMFIGLLVFDLCLALAITFINGLNSDPPMWFLFIHLSIFLFGLGWAITGLVTRIITDTKEKNNLKITQDGKE